MRTSHKRTTHTHTHAEDPKKNGLIEKQDNKPRQWDVIYFLLVFYTYAFIIGANVCVRASEIS